jgi:hypothetical protein
VKKIFALGLHISHNWDDDTIAISQEKLIGEALARFGMLSCAPCTTPLSGGVTLTSVTTHPPLNRDEESRYRSMLGTLQYIATMTRPDLCYAASTREKFMVKHPGAKGCTDDGTLAIVPIYIPNLD